MARYHISQKGEPAICRATIGRCPLGGESVHFDNKDEATNYIETRFQKQYNIFTPSGLHESIESNDKTWTTAKRSQALGLESYSSGNVVAKRKNYAESIRQKIYEISPLNKSYYYTGENEKGEYVSKFIKFDDFPPREKMDVYNSLQSSIDEKNNEYDRISREIAHMRNTVGKIPRETLKRQKKIKKELTKLERQSILLEKKAPEVQKSYYDILNSDFNRELRQANLVQLDDARAYRLLTLRKRMARMEFNSPKISESSNQRLYGDDNNQAKDVFDTHLDSRTSFPHSQSDTFINRPNESRISDEYKDVRIYIPPAPDEGWKLKTNDYSRYNDFRTDEEIERADKELDDLINKTKKENRRSLVFGRFKKKAKTVPPPPEPPAGFGTTQPNYSFPPLPQQNNQYGTGEWGGWGSGSLPPTMQENNNQGQFSGGYGAQSSYW